MAVSIVVMLASCSGDSDPGVESSGPSANDPTTSSTAHSVTTPTTVTTEPVTTSTAPPTELPATSPPSTTPDAGPSPDASVEIYAAAVRHILDFNSLGHQFSEVLIVNHINSQITDPLGSPEPLTDKQRAAITSAIEDLASVTFIDEQSEGIEEGTLTPVSPNSAVVTLGPLAFDDEGATVGANLWCGGLCGIWLTYRLVEGPDGWTVTGTEGPIMIS